MNILFFYATIAVLFVIFFTTIRKKGFTVRHMILMLGYSLYNLIFELTFGEIFELYYYIEKTHSLIFIIIASVLLYPVLAVLYVFFLPEGKKVIGYTAGFIIATMILEQLSIYTRTIVLTGWMIFPWSIIAYIVSFGLIYFFNRLLIKVLPDS